ncbi:MAG: metallophosphoesterase [Alphaproteobacteria bacterium]|nr:metallophosphoesterase [Alphaproteobacteria bacterium]
MIAVGLGLALAADSLRRVYAVGQEANDHFVAALVLGCQGFYVVQALAAPPWLAPAMLVGLVWTWGFFFCVHREGPTPRWARWLLGVPSQLAYAWALWAGLVWLLRAPVALAMGWDVWWAGPLNLLPLALALVGWLDCYGRAGRLHRHALPGLPAPVAHLSDLHVSPLLHRAELDALVDRVNALEPAVVVITGDLVMPFSEREHGYLLDALARLRAPTFACPGNHDLPVLERLRAELAGVGVRMLVDESVTVAGLAITGVNFHWREARTRLDKALERLPPGDDAYRVLLAHDPRLGAWVPDGRFDLVLSGHTHGGHVAGNALGLPGSVLRLAGIRDQGWWPAGSGRQFVHRGNWSTGLPPRMGVAAEVVLLEPQASSNTTGA